MIKENKIELTTGFITYNQSSETGRAVVLLHGNSSSYRIFQDQIEDTSFEGIRLIALDLPGHGKSEPANDPKKSYSVPGFAATVSEFIDALSLTDVIVVGHSLGGHVAMEAAQQDERIKAIMVVGAVPLTYDPAALEKMFLPTAPVGLGFQEQLNETEKMAFAEIAYNGGEIPPFAVEDLGQTDRAFRPSFGASIGEGVFADEAKFICETDVPVAVVFGEEESIYNADYMKELVIKNLWRNKPILLPGGHAPFWSFASIFNRTLQDFLDEV